MKKYKVKVNGKVYEVELEAIEEVNGSIQNTKVEEKKVIPSSNGVKTNIVAPIGGKILDVKVSTGQNVKKGQVVCIIEAMKLENEVVSSVDGVISEVKATKGATVNNKDVLFIIG